MSRSFILLLAAVLFLSPAMAQDRAMDSLKNALTKSGEDTSRVNTLIALTKAFLGSSPDTSLSYASQARDLAARLRFTKGEAYALKYIGIYYYNQAKNIETLDYWLKSLELFRSIHDQVGIANMLSNIGSFYYNQADDAKALDYYLQSLRISEVLGDKLRMATALQNIGNTYLR